jgi:hypothetical protein
MRVSFVLRSAEAYLVARCILPPGNYRVNHPLNEIVQRFAPRELSGIFLR